MVNDIIGFAMRRKITVPNSLISSLQGRVSMRGSSIVTKTFLASAAAGIFLSVAAQTINLTGTVKDSGTQKGIGGATVALAVQKISVLTDSSGSYTLSNQSSVRPGSAKNDVLISPVMQHSNLFFGVTANGERVRIDLYSLSGRHVAAILDARLDQGNYQIDPGQSISGSQIYVVKIQTGLQTATFRMPCLNSTGKGRELLKKSSAGPASGAAAKKVLVSDTLLVSAPGYAVARSAITSYTGAKDFSLVWSGTGGSIMFENASYQGCQYPAYLSVLDSSVHGTSLNAHVRSTTNPAGFTFSLKQVSGMVGTYADSLYFSIAKSDSTKHILRVADMDSVVASYDHGALSHPGSLRTTSTVWSGTTGQIGPGASQYFGLRAKMHVNLFDGDITDSVAFVTIKSPKDTVGITLKLKALPGNPGSFNGALGFSLTSSIQDSIIAVDGRDSLGQLITMIYHDAAPPATLYGSICTWIPAVGTLLLDSTAYHGTAGKMGITLIDDDILDSIAIVTVKSKHDATGIKDTLKANPDITGQFLGSIGFSMTASAARVIAVSGSDSVAVTYQDDTPTKTITSKASWNAN